MEALALCREELWRPWAWRSCLICDIRLQCRAAVCGWHRTETIWSSAGLSVAKKEQRCFLVAFIAVFVVSNEILFIAYVCLFKFCCHSILFRRCWRHFADLNTFREWFQRLVGKKDVTHFWYGFSLNPQALKILFNFRDCWAICVACYLRAENRAQIGVFTAKSEALKPRDLSSLNTYNWVLWSVRSACRTNHKPTNGRSEISSVGLSRRARQESFLHEKPSRSHNRPLAEIWLKCAAVVGNLCLGTPHHELFVPCIPTFSACLFVFFKA